MCAGSKFNNLLNLLKLIRLRKFPGHDWHCAIHLELRCGFQRPALKAMGVVARAKDKGLAREQHYKSFNKRVEQPEQPEREKTPWGWM